MSWDGGSWRGVARGIRHSTRGVVCCGNVEINVNEQNAPRGAIRWRKNSIGEWYYASVEECDRTE